MRPFFLLFSGILLETIFEIRSADYYRISIVNDRSVYFLLRRNASDPGEIGRERFLVILSFVIWRYSYVI